MMAKAKESRTSEDQTATARDERASSSLQNAPPQQQLQPQRERASSAQSLQGREDEGRQTGMARRRDQQWLPTAWAGGPFTFMRRLSEEMDRIFEDFGMGRGLSRQGFSSQTMWAPQIEMFEREGNLIVRADLPGMSRDDINVEVMDNAIHLNGERRDEREENREGYYRSERSYGSFHRTIPLPEGVNAEQANATFRNGVLEITMPAPERAGQHKRRLEIREEGDETSQAKGRAAGANRE